MSEEIPRPIVGKLVTMVAVCQGAPVVASGTVLVSKRHLLAATTNLEGEAFRGLAGAPVTVLYGAGEFTMILRGRIDELVTPDRVVISTPDPPRFGERREYIRADIDVGVRVERAPAHAGDEKAVAEWLGSFVDDESSYSFSDTTVDLSGSGARFECSVLLKKGEYGALSLLLDEGRKPRLLHLALRTVRGRPAKDGEGTFELAVEFLQLSEDARDLLNHLVFESRARRLGLSLVNLTDGSEQE